MSTFSFAKVFWSIAFPGVSFFQERIVIKRQCDCISRASMYLSAVYNHTVRLKLHSAASVYMIPDLLAIVDGYCKMDAVDVVPMLSTRYCCCAGNYRADRGETGETGETSQDWQREANVERSATVYKQNQRKQEIRQYRTKLRQVLPEQLSRRKSSARFR